MPFATARLAAVWTCSKVGRRIPSIRVPGERMGRMMENEQFPMPRALVYHGLSMLSQFIIHNCSPSGSASGHTPPQRAKRQNPIYPETMKFGCNRENARSMCSRPAVLDLGLFFLRMDAIACCVHATAMHFESSIKRHVQTDFRYDALKLPGPGAGFGILQTGMPSPQSDHLTKLRAGCAGSWDARRPVASVAIWHQRYHRVDQVL